MKIRKQTLVAILAALGAPLAASAAGPETWYMPLSTWRTIENAKSANAAGDDAGAPTSYPLLSYSSTKPEQQTVAKDGSNGAGGYDAAKATSYALSSYAAPHGRG